MTLIMADVISRAGPFPSIIVSPQCKPLALFDFSVVHEHWVMELVGEEKKCVVFFLIFVILASRIAHTHER